MAKIALIVADNYRDPELDDTKSALETAGHQVTVASKQTGTLNGADGGSVNADSTIDSIAAANYDGIAVIGGPGMYDTLYNDAATTTAITNKISEFNSAGKLVGAICIGPIALAKANIISGKTLTSWTDPAQKEKGILETAGATFTGNPVEQDGNIITANGPAAASQFGQKLVEYFTSTPSS